MHRTSAVNIRQDMALKGWQSEDRLTTFGFGQDIDGSPNWGYSIWFERWDWHGVPCEKVSFVVEVNDMTEIQRAVKKCADMALKAWADNPVSPPNEYDQKEKYKERFKGIQRRTKK